jgi:hypothetical protein
MIEAEAVGERATTADGGRTAGEIRTYLLERLNATLRRPVGGEASIRLIIDALAFVDGREQSWTEALRALEAQGACPSTGVRGAFDRLWGKGWDDMVASVYAQIVHSHGWLRLDRELPQSDYDELLEARDSWCGQDRDLGQILAVFGSPSIQFGGTNPYYPRTLAYTTGRAGDRLVCFHLWNELKGPNTGRMGLYHEPVLLAVRSGGPDFVGGFSFTPVGETRRRDREH